MRYCRKLLRQAPFIGVVLLTLSTCLNLSRGASVQKPVVPSPDTRFASGHSALKIPFELSNNLVLLQVQINASRPLWFIFDTGANSSVINASLVKELNLQPKEKVQGNAGGGKIEAELIPGVTLSVPGVAVSNQTIASLPIDVFSPVFGKPIGGILGYGFIKQFVVEIDYAAQVMNLYAPASFNRDLSGEILPIKFINLKPFVDAKIKLDGRDAVAGTFMIDTGADAVMTINAPFVKKQMFLNSLPTVRQSNSGGAGGVSKSVTARVQNIQLGSFVIPNSLVEFSQATEGTDILASYAGVLGGEVFRRFTMIVDYSRQRIILQPNAFFAQPVEADMSGLELMADGEDFKAVVVNEVATDSPGAAAGLKGEDELVAVDDRPVAEIGLAKIRQMFKQNGKEYSLKIKRGEQILPVKIKLRRLM